LFYLFCLFGLFCLCFLLFWDLHFTPNLFVGYNTHFGFCVMQHLRRSVVFFYFLVLFVFTAWKPHWNTMCRTNRLRWAGFKDAWRWFAWRIHCWKQCWDRIWLFPQSAHRAEKVDRYKVISKLNTHTHTHTHTQWHTHTHTHTVPHMHILGHSFFKNIPHNFKLNFLSTQVSQYSHNYKHKKKWLNGLSLSGRCLRTYVPPAPCTVQLISTVHACFIFIDFLTKWFEKVRTVVRRSNFIRRIIMICSTVLTVVHCWNVLASDLFSLFQETKKWNRNADALHPGPNWNARLFSWILTKSFEKVRKILTLKLCRNEVEIVIVVPMKWERQIYSRFFKRLRQNFEYFQKNWKVAFLSLKFSQYVFWPSCLGK